MNDRFSSQLRQHLLETANERPAEATIAAIGARVATTDQRIPLVARLTLDPGRIGGFPTAALRFVLVAVALGFAIAGAALLAGAARDRSTVFEGSWTTPDLVDGSTQVLFVSSGITPDVKYVDDFSTGGACVDDPAKIFTADGTATVDGSVLHVAFPDGGGCGLQTVEVGPGSYTYNEATDTIVDDLGFRWERVDRVVPSNDPTTSPTPDPTSPPTPDPTPDDGSVGACVDLADGGTYTAPVGPLSATATVPDGNRFGWEGTPGLFYLRISCSDGEVPISIHPSTATSINSGTCVPHHAGEIADFADAVARLSAPKVDDISDPIELTIGGHPAVRFDVTELSGCAGFGLWNGTTLGEGESGSVYVIDVDGEVVAIEVNRNSDATQAQFDEAGAIVASLRFGDPATQPTASAPPASASPATPPPVPADPTSSAPPSAEAGAPSSLASPDPTNSAVAPTADPGEVSSP